MKIRTSIVAAVAAFAALPLATLFAVAPVWAQGSGPRPAENNRFVSSAYYERVFANDDGAATNDPKSSNAGVDGGANYAEPCPDCGCYGECGCRAGIMHRMWNVMSCLRWQHAQEEEVICRRQGGGPFRHHGNTWNTAPYAWKLFGWIALDPCCGTECDPCAYERALLIKSHRPPPGCCDDVYPGVYCGDCVNCGCYGWSAAHHSPCATCGGSYWPSEIREFPVYNAPQPKPPTIQNPTPAPTRNGMPPQPIPRTVPDNMLDPFQDDLDSLNKPSSRRMPSVVEPVTTRVRPTGIMSRRLEAAQSQRPDVRPVEQEPSDWFAEISPEVKVNQDARPLYTQPGIADLSDRHSPVERTAVRPASMERPAGFEW